MAQTQILIVESDAFFLLFCEHTIQQNAIAAGLHHPPCSRLGAWGSVVSSPSAWGLGQSPSRKRFGGISCAILCDFDFRAFNSCLLMGSLYWMVGLMFHFDFLGCRTVGHPHIEFLACPDTDDNVSG